jgi:hypothetical protein
MHRLLALSLTLFSFLGPSGGEPATPLEAVARGSVTGRVTVSAEPPAPPASLSPYARRRYMPPQSPGVPGGEEDAFVYAEPLGGGPPARSTAPTRILQRERTIIPHVSVTQVGQLVEFPNEDDVYHNLFSLSPGNRFSLGRYAPGVTETNTFEHAGVVQLFCDIHAEMAGVILVVATPHVTRVETGGAYNLTGLSAGSYRLIAWHPVAGADTVEITLQETQQASRDFSLPAGR